MMHMVSKGPGPFPGFGSVSDAAERRTRLHKVAGGLFC